MSLTVEQSALLERVESAGRYINFDKLSPSDRQIAQTLVMEKIDDDGYLIRLMSRRIEGKLVPNPVYALIDRENLFRY
jgi:hypothetical protein